MTAAFYVAAGVAVAGALLFVTSRDPVHGLLYLVVSFLATAVDIYLLGATLAAALQVIVYAGAIMVLFVFAVMVSELGPAPSAPGGRLGAWALPAVVSAGLLVAILFVLSDGPAAAPLADLAPRDVGLALYGRYLVGVELASLLLLAGLVAAFQIARGLRGVAEAEDEP